MCLMTVLHHLLQQSASLAASDGRSQFAPPSAGRFWRLTISGEAPAGLLGSLQVNSWRFVLLTPPPRIHPRLCGTAECSQHLFASINILWISPRTHGRWQCQHAAGLLRDRADRAAASQRLMCRRATDGGYNSLADDRARTCCNGCQSEHSHSDAKVLPLVAAAVLLWVCATTAASPSQSNCMPQYQRRCIPYAVICSLVRHQHASVCVPCIDTWHTSVCIPRSVRTHQGGWMLLLHGCIWSLLLRCLLRVWRRLLHLNHRELRGCSLFSRVCRVAAQSASCPAAGRLLQEPCMRCI